MQGGGCQKERNPPGFPHIEQLARQFPPKKINSFTESV
jgi:hypothetical protein